MELSKLDKLKKKKAENMLDEKQLDEVAGGKAFPFSGFGEDNRFLRKLLGNSVINKLGGKVREVEVAAWKMVGVRVRQTTGGVFYFADNSKKSFDSKKDLYEYAMNAVGKHLTKW